MDPIVIVGEAVAGREAKLDALRKRIRALASDVERNTFDLAEAFFQAQESHCYAEWGFESLGEYASLELGIKHRRAQYLAKIVRVCRACGVARKDWEPAGTSKLRVITGLDPESSFFNRETKINEPMVEHIVRLIAEAPELTTVEVAEEVQRLMGNVGENAMVTKSYRVTKSAYEHTVQRCFESVRKRLGSKGRDGTGAAVEYTDGNCLEAVCAEYNSDPRNFMEELDESKEQIEVPTEETNVSSTGSLSTPGTSGTPIHVDITEEPQDTLPRPSVPFVVPTED
jgi:hypothetical protein